jgi:hypothetical protein
MSGEAYDNGIISDYIADHGTVVRYAKDGSVYHEATVFAHHAVSHEFGTNPIKQSRVKPGNLIGSLTSNGPYARTELKYQLEKFEETTAPSGYPSLYSENFHYKTVAPITPSLSVVDNRSRTKHLNRVRGLSTDYSSDLAEARKAADGFKSAAYTVKDIWNRVKKKKRSRKNLSICDVASANLAVEFGIKPTLNALHTSAQRIQGLHENRIARVSTTHHENGEVTLAGGQVWDVRQTTTWISYMQISNTLYGNSINFGNPVEWAWELIPYSFVVDYVFNVGDTIAALGAERGLNHLGSTETIRRRGKLDSIPPTPDYTVVNRGSGTSESYVRNLHLDLPTPNIVQLDLSSSLKALTNATSVLTSINDRCSYEGRRPGRVAPRRR